MRDTKTTTAKATAPNSPKRWNKKKRIIEKGRKIDKEWKCEQMNEKERKQKKKEGGDGDGK